jgi:hypothetical protein
MKLQHAIADGLLALLQTQQVFSNPSNTRVENAIENLKRELLFDLTRREREPSTMADDLAEALDALHDLREFWLDNVTQSQPGSGATNPMWVRIAEVLDKHGMNQDSLGGLHADRYRRFDPAYHPLTRK